MEPFTLTDLTNLYFSGYRYVIVQNRGDHAILKPLTRQAPTELIAVMKVVQLPLLESSVVEMAKGVKDFPVFLPENIYDPNYKEYVLS